MSRSKEMRSAEGPFSRTATYEQWASLHPTGDPANGRRILKLPEGFLVMAMDTIPSALDMAFRTSLLLAGNTKTAEASVMDGIGACEDLSHCGLLIEAVRSTIRRRTKSTDASDALELLPPELRRLFMLQPLSRDCSPPIFPNPSRF